MKKRSKSMQTYSCHLIYRLLVLSDSKEDFLEKIEKRFVGLLDILSKYESITMTLDEFFQVSPKIMVRF
jgi:flagellar capping protein FliD